VGKLLRVSILCWRHRIGNLGTIEQLGNLSDQSAYSGGGSKKIGRRDRLKASRRLVASV
jgi:hypothetical protein